MKILGIFLLCFAIGWFIGTHASFAGSLLFLIVLISLLLGSMLVVSFKK